MSFQRIINLNKGQFKSAADKTEKLRIAKAIVQSIHESKARFVERSNDAAGEWREVDVREATKVVIFALMGVQPVPVKAEVIDITVKDEVDVRDTTPEKRLMNNLKLQRVLKKCPWINRGYPWPN